MEGDTPEGGGQPQGTPEPKPTALSDQPAPEGGQPEGDAAKEAAEKAAAEKAAAEKAAAEKDDKDGKDKDGKDGKDKDGKDGKDKDGKDKDGKDKDDKDKKEGAPEKYDDFKVPEGVEVDEEAMGEFQGLAKDLNLSQEQAQKLVDFQGKFMEKFTNNLQGQWDKQRDTWLEEAKKDETIGGKNFEQNVELAKRGLKAYGSPELVKLIDSFGIGNHKAVIAAFAKAGKEVSEDTITQGNPANGGQKTLAERIFGGNAKT